MYHMILALLVLALAGCNTAATRDVNSPEYEIPHGSKIVLVRALDIPSGYSHIYLQDGVQSTGADEYTVSCRFETRNLGPATIQPDTFMIRETSSMQNWVSRPDSMRFYREFHIDAGKQPDVLKFVCQYVGEPLSGRPVSVPEMEKAVGTYVHFEFAP